MVSFDEHQPAQGIFIKYAREDLVECGMELEQTLGTAIQMRILGQSQRGPRGRHGRRGTSQSHAQAGQTDQPLGVMRIGLGQLGIDREEGIHRRQTRGIGMAPGAELQRCEATGGQREREGIHAQVGKEDRIKPGGHNRRQSGRQVLGNRDHLVGTGGVALGNGLARSAESQQHDFKLVSRQMFDQPEVQVADGVVAEIFREQAQPHSLLP